MIGNHLVRIKEEEQGCYMNKQRKIKIVDTWIVLYWYQIYYSLRVSSIPAVSYEETAITLDSYGF